MSLFDRVFAEEELRSRPPVLLDVGAAGPLHGPWATIARSAIGVAFEPDARSAAATAAAKSPFLRSVTCRYLAVPEATPESRQKLFLTRSPLCSSTLRPDAAALSEWTFARFFEVVGEARLRAATLEQALGEHRLDRIDWLKCDTQGLDFRLYQTLPPELKAGILALEFEPGIIGAYPGEERLGEALLAMQGQPYWLADFTVGATPRVKPARLGLAPESRSTNWLRRLAPPAPAWANLRYLRDPQAGPAPNRRSCLLGWVFATATRQPGHALEWAQIAESRFGGGLFSEMAEASRRSVWRQSFARLPSALWTRLVRP